MDTQKKTSLAKVVKPPFEVIWGPEKSIFLAGTIDDGASVDWQSEVEKELNDLNVLILNPRRDQWDSSWEQTITNPQFKQQVEWELDGLDKADEILVYFAPDSKSPITLLELGLHATKNNLTIICPRGFWRRGNIEVIADRYNLPLFESIEEGLAAVRGRL